MPTFKVTSSMEDRTRIAHEQSALLSTRLALARWSTGGQEPQLTGHGDLLLRAVWYDQAERNFQAWLDAGGFTQYDETARDQSCPALERQMDSAKLCQD
ncbi:hypothetical protein [Massilia horti]|uniref:Uncharacterized protein n=1 Tax=Massilia horti TaxID=2562153 RepID=A0A4Y9T3H2_9BURK|nr:hypothetical protein [Massilia horti]TFW32055.1 hypothetical protein E4O92_11105 [Massilia horti]